MSATHNHSRAILGFLDFLARKDVTMHGFIMRQGGHTLAEGYWKPFAAHLPHRMYSVGKSLTSLAIGMLAADGLLTLADQITAHFPDKLPPDVSPRLQRATIRDLLCMTSPHSETTYVKTEDTDWARTFFTVPPSNDPGTVFAYDTSASHVLSALVERLSGQSLLAFLKGRLFDPLGCEGEIRWLTDPVGVCQGGSGLIMTLPDLARVTECLLRGGDGLIPPDYLAEATAMQVNTLLLPRQAERHGYGYQFWRTPHDGFLMFGMGGQLAFCLPRHQFMLCTTADTRLDHGGVEAIHDALWTHMLPSLEAQAPIEDEDAARALANRLATLAVQPIAGIPGSQYPADRYRFAENPMGLTALRLLPDALLYENATGSHRLSYAEGGWAHGIFPGSQEPCMASGSFVRPDVFRLLAHLVGDTLGGVDLQLVFQQDRVTIQARCVEEPVLRSLRGVASGVRD